MVRSGFPCQQYERLRCPSLGVPICPVLIMPKVVIAPKQLASRRLSALGILWERLRWASPQREAAVKITDDPCPRNLVGKPPNSCRPHLAATPGLVAITRRLPGAEKRMGCV